jgi:hypothetical protein
MSNSASIAAAKRRRGASQNPPVAASSSASSSRNINRVKSEPTLELSEQQRQKISPIQILGMHENRIEFLEKQHNNMAMALNQYPNPNQEKIVTLKDLEDFRQAFQKLSSSEKKTDGETVNVQQIKKEVSEELTKTQLPNLASKKDVDTMISLLRKELLSDNFKSLEDKINALKISNSEISSSSSISSQKEIQEITKTLTKKIDDSIPKNTINSKQLDDVKNEIMKKVDAIQVPKDCITSKQLSELKNEFNTRFESLPKVSPNKESTPGEEKLSLTTKARIETLENKVKALEAIVLKK